MNNVKRNVKGSKIFILVSKDNLGISFNTKPIIIPAAKINTEI